MNMTATYQPKAMLSTPFNNRKGEKRLVTSANRYSAKKPAQAVSSTHLKASSASKGLNARAPKSSDNVNEEKNPVTEPMELTEKGTKTKPEGEQNGPQGELKLEDLQPNNQSTEVLAPNAEKPVSVFNYQGFGQSMPQTQNQTADPESEKQPQAASGSAFGGYSMGQQEPAKQGSAFGGYAMG